MRSSQELRRAVREDVPRIRTELEQLIAIPSISASGFDPKPLRESAEATAEILRDAGFRDVRLLEVEGAPPAVFGEAAGPDGSPTVLLYAHHDVQPPGPEDAWDSPPFEPTERGGRLYGRGACDDKVGIVAHGAALRAFAGSPPVRVKFLVEGEEETGSEHLPQFLASHGEQLAADVVVVPDMSNWKLGVPSLTTSLRGLVDCVVEVRTLDHAAHSGTFGGPVPDALSVLATVLATLHDDRGAVAVPGLATGPPPDIDQDEEGYRRDVGARPGVHLIGEGSITERLWMRPAVSVVGIDAPSVAEASNQLVPVARAKVSLRLAPGDDPDRAMDALAAHLESHAPWGAEVRVHPATRARPFSVQAKGPAFDAARSALREAWGTEPVDVGSGGTIPLMAALADAFPEAAILLTGVGDPLGHAHAENESLDLGELERICVAEALLLSYLAQGRAEGKGSAR